jgi:hypothetical protein
MVFDMHSTGRAASVMICGFLYHCMNACLYEFIQQIGPQVWSDTVVNVTGEFSRNPRHIWSSVPTHPDYWAGHWKLIQGPDGAGGSDHAWWGSGMTLLTGQVGQSGLCIVGNVDPDPIQSQWGPVLGAYRWNYCGTWGAAGMLDIDGGFHLANMGNLTSTVASLLNVEAPLPNFGPMAKVVNGAYQSQTECINIANAPRASGIPSTPKGTAEDGVI